MISYNRLWKLLIDKKIKKMEFKEMTGLGSSSISKLNEDKVVSMATMEKICLALDCNIEDIVEIKKDIE
ncbi:MULTISPECIES: helix-turn-helix domain-containing protein [unclassified Clostridioides]|uniref:helix-turn-helix domain-containing protein n=1 Tax=unclassified Clostridioides TaxID=2635829 RepID=UPI001D0BFA02|nr:helix-turn-helix domain-containing protein [Clostridioides sp. ES-S-0001-02]MCC0652113.1 helix-turn-helix domain-containing protein [Clostridioides sp. ES-S-0001-03]MCC0655550.1 helix-turn-helix domain-containing protein [Clostridioides sp. ES-S-0123-01]MCC0679195.1 helix-turn-helix domain-containing protein [Clostridioides sp. ES-S-0005-03]MCC0694494.1 helix-turn-helix domain-containing protein [Clostridioides sp. ES-S-0048-02]MCC0702645.1 helix-turn-helix domain-containing protein [Clostr